MRRLWRGRGVAAGDSGHRGVGEAEQEADLNRYHEATVARRRLEAGASIVNDAGATRKCGNVARGGESEAGYVLMHARGNADDAARGAVRGCGAGSRRIFEDESDGFAIME